MPASEPRVLTDDELLRFEQSDKCRWFGKSLLLTIANDRETAARDREVAIEEKQLLQCELGTMKAQLKWFEETYSTKAWAPLKRASPKGQECPACKKLEAFHLGRFWLCFGCGHQWEVAPADEIPF